jgi:hypothetical protein
MSKACMLALAGAAAACSVPDLELDGKQCPCVDGWVCDEPTNTCVRDPSGPDAPPGTADGPLADAMPGACPAGYMTRGSAPSSYRVVDTLTLWLTAEQDCENDGTGTHLVIFDDAAERDAVLAGLAGDWWIGLTDRVNEGTWLAVTAQTGFFTAGAAPGGQTTDCGLADVAGAIGSQSCFADDSYICECDGAAAVPANY